MQPVTDKSSEAGTQDSTWIQLAHNFWDLLNTGNSEISSDSMLTSVQQLWMPVLSPQGWCTLWLQGKQALPESYTQKAAPDKQKLFPISFPREALLSFTARTTGHDSLHFVCSFCYIYFPNIIFSHISPLCSYHIHCAKTTLILISYLTKTSVA